MPLKLYSMIPCLQFPEDAFHSKVKWCDHRHRCARISMENLHRDLAMQEKLENDSLIDMSKKPLTFSDFFAFEGLVN